MGRIHPTAFELAVEDLLRLIPEQPGLSLKKTGAAVKLLRVMAVLVCDRQVKDDEIAILVAGVAHECGVSESDLKIIRENSARRGS